MSQIWAYLQLHPGIVAALTGLGYHIMSAFIGSLEMPDTTSSKLYRFFFNFSNLLAANYSRAKASQGPAGQMPPKEP